MNISVVIPCHNNGTHLAETLASESLTRVLYPDDSTSRGQGLRFLQEYFLVACSLADLVRRFRANNADWSALPDKVAIQLNDTHPAIAVPELMRLLVDERSLPWERAWDITRRAIAYTNHTLLPEALEKWTVSLFGRVLPRLARAVMKVSGATAYNILQNNGPAAHQAVFHVHFHIIPKLGSDGLGIGWKSGKLDGTEGAALANELAAAL